MVTAVFLYPFLPHSAAGLCSVMLSKTSSGPLLIPSIFHQQLFQNRLFHILTNAIWWLACLFHKFLYTIYIFVKAFSVLYWSFMKITHHWQIYQVIPLFPKYQSYIQRVTELEGTSGQHCTWTSLDECLQDILLEVCPSIHPSVKNHSDWLRDWFYNEHNVFGNRCPTHHSHPERTFSPIWLLF